MANYRSLGASLGLIRGFNRTLDHAIGGLTGTLAWVPAMDVAERRDAYVVHTELPGVKPEQVDVGFEQNVLTIRGTKSASFDDDNRREVRQFAAERVSGFFERSVRLPDVVDADRIEASFSNGLLTVTVPKAQSTKARRIALRTLE